ncbi:MAG: S-adenosylmethionine:tRNA ribosyltransferase-isomerase [Spirochaetes bacterium]|nr:S-adenosylmethionine:tRNA ribosyltransferase-isomerase [Spirochaetota bacterium]
MSGIRRLYAKEYGAVAAPTAGLHFTDELLNQIRDKGAQIAFLTLYVSWGTFQPVRVDDIRLHKMHTEEYFLPKETVEAIYKAKESGGRIIAVGTTSLRVLESVYSNGKYSYGHGATDIFIHPPYKVESVDALITNFHTPKSTLLMLVAAFAGYDCIMDAYKEAVKEKYRFFSYGDAMLII